MRSYEASGSVLTATAASALRGDLAEGGAGDRAEEDEPLELIDSHIGEEAALIGTFYALGNHRQLQRVAQRDHALDHLARGVRGGRGDKRAIDLELRHGQFVQATQRGLADAEVVQ